MDDTPITKRPWFYIATWLFILLAIYGWQLFRIWSVLASVPYILLDILLDLVCLFPFLLLLWVAFFAQFVLPVRTFRDRQKIFDRLLTYLSSGHGPAMFIRNGELIKKEGEEKKRGPGVLWLDSASAAVTRTPTKIKQVIGPGVHFTDSGEFFAGIADLHIQIQGIGPLASDKPFEIQEDEENYSQYTQVQNRRKQVSALTRDGIEVVPFISVAFRIDTNYPKEDQPGSRFGYRTGITKKDKENETRDKEAIKKALLGEGINPHIKETESPLHRVAWNQLPALLAADVWREYVSKFTLDELFKPDQVVPPPEPPIPEPEEVEIDPLSQPLQLGIGQNKLEDNLTGMLRELNKLMTRAIKWLDGRGKAEMLTPVLPVAPPSSHHHAAKGEPQKKTALQVITEMVKARLTQLEVDVFDDNGVRGTGTISSSEFKLLQSRGLKVLNVSISTPRLQPEIEQTIIDRWTGTWLSSAKQEQKQIERKKIILESSGQEDAIRQYSNQLSHDLLQIEPKGIKSTLTTLIMSTRAIIVKNDILRKNMTAELEKLGEIIKWMEVEEE